MIVEQNMTIYTAADLKPRLMEVVMQSESPEFDLSAVSEIDGAGVQLLMLVRREAALIGRTVRFVEPHPAVLEVLGVLQLGAELEACRGSSAASTEDVQRPTA